MAYSDFSFSTVKNLFQLETIEDEPAIPKGSIERNRLVDLERTIEENLPLATAIGTSKARSSLLIAPILVEVRRLLDRQVSLFLGTEFNVESELGLSGVCDYILSLSPEQYVVEAPILVLVEAKEADLSLGIGQMAAQMVAAQKFNHQHEKEMLERVAYGRKALAASNSQDRARRLPCVYGCISSGAEWQFLRLEDRILTIDPIYRNLKPIEALIGSMLQIFP